MNFTWLTWALIWLWLAISLNWQLENNSEVNSEEDFIIASQIIEETWFTQDKVKVILSALANRQLTAISFIGKNIQTCEQVSEVLNKTAQYWIINIVTPAPTNDNKFLNCNVDVNYNWENVQTFPISIQKM